MRLRRIAVNSSAKAIATLCGEISSCLKIESRGFEGRGSEAVSVDGETRLVPLPLMSLLVVVVVVVLPPVWLLMLLLLPLVE